MQTIIFSVIFKDSYICILVSNIDHKFFPIFCKRPKILLNVKKNLSLVIFHKKIGKTTQINT